MKRHCFSALGEDRGALIVVPIVKNGLQQVDIGALGHGVEEAPDHPLAAVSDSCYRQAVVGSIDGCADPTGAPRTSWSAPGGRRKGLLLAARHLAGDARAAGRAPRGPAPPARAGWSRTR